MLCSGWFAIFKSILGSWQEAEKLKDELKCQINDLEAIKRKWAPMEKSWPEKIPKELRVINYLYSQLPAGLRSAKGLLIGHSSDENLGKFLLFPLTKNNNTSGGDKNAFGKEGKLKLPRLIAGIVLLKGIKDKDFLPAAIASPHCLWRRS